MKDLGLHWKLEPVRNTVIVVKLTPDRKIFGYSPKQLLLLLAVLLIARTGCLLPNSAIKIAGLPVNIWLFVGIAACGIALINMPNAAPVFWWRRKLQIKNKQLSAYLPDVSLSADQGRAQLQCENGVLNYLKFRAEDFTRLGLYAQSDVKSRLLEAAKHHKLQFFRTTAAPGTLSNNTVYLLCSDTIQQNLTQQLQECGLAIESAGKDEISNILFSHLSPSRLLNDSEPTNEAAPLALLDYCASGFTHTSDFVQIEERYARSIFLQDLPPVLAHGLIDRLSETDISFSLSVHLHPCDTNEVKRMAKFAFHLGAAGLTGTVKPLTSEQISELRNIADGTSSMVDLSLYVTVYSESLESANSDIELVVSVFKSFGVSARTVPSKQLEALLSGLPISQDKVLQCQRINGSAAAALLPF